MPVIQLPFDDRWGQLGKGLGNVLGSIIQAAADKQIDTGVATIVNDDTVPQDQKVNNIMQKFGLKGVAAYGKQMDLKVKEHQLNLIDAETKGKQQSNELQAATLPDQITKAKLANEKTSGEIVDTAADAAYKTAITDPTVREREAGAQKTQLEADQLRQLMEAGRNMTADPSAFKQRLGEQGITDPTEQARVIDAYTSAAPGKGAAAAQAVINSIASDKARVTAADKAAQRTVSKPAQLREKDIDTAANAQELAASTKNFMTAMEGEGKTGFASGATIKALAEKYGWATGDPNTLTMAENAQQAISQKATGGGGFFAQGRVTLAKDVTPSLGKSLLSNVIAVDAVADQQLANLRARRSAALPNQNTKPLDDAIDNWDTLRKEWDLHSYVTTADSAGNQRSVVIFKGNQVDPATLKPVVEGQHDYPTGAGSVKGSDLIAAAQARQMTPAQLLAMLRAKSGYKGSDAPEPSKE